MAAYTLPERADIQRDITALESRFQSFHTYRDIDGLWNKLVKRELPEAIPIDLAAKQEGIDFQSPDPAKAIQDHKAVLKKNPPYFDVQVPGETQRSRDAERDHLLVKSSWFQRTINPRRRWEDRVYEGVIRHGCKVEWLRANSHKPNYDKGDLDPQRGCPNYFDNTLLDGNLWTDEDEDGADAHFYRYTVPVHGCNLQNKEGKKVTLATLDTIGWLGPQESHDESIVTAASQVEITVRDARDLAGALCPLEGCDHVRRVITVYVCAKGQKFDKAEEVESYPSPFPGSSFFVIGGQMFQTERDPDRIYRPLMEPMYVLQAWLNMLITWHAVLALQESSDSQLYGDASQANPANVQLLLMREGGLEESVKLPEAGVGEVPVYPFPLNRVPKKTSTEVMGLIRLCLEMMQEYKVNRKMMGLDFTEQSNGTASANLAALEQSGLPYTVILDEVAGAIDKWDRYTDHQIRWNAWFEPDDEQTRYYATVTGEENVMSYSGTTRRGESVWLDAKKCAIAKDLIVKIENLTGPEKQQRWYLALSQFQSGVKTVDDLIRASGVFDVIAQKRLLQRDQIRQSLTPLIMRMNDLLLTRRASANTGFDFGALLQQVTPQQGMVEPPGTAEGNPQGTQAANAARSTVTLPPRDTPSGGTQAG